MPDIKGILGPVQLTVLALSGAFVIASLAGRGAFLIETSLFFIYAIIAAYVRQIYKDKVYFLREANKLKKLSDENLLLETQLYWKRYYIFQVVFLMLVAAGLFLLSIILDSYGS